MPRRAPAAATRPIARAAPFAAALLVAPLCGVFGIVAVPSADHSPRASAHFAGQSAGAPVESPLDVIRRSNLRVTRILRPGHKVTPADRTTVLQLLQEVTDFDAVAANVLGARWASIPEAEQTEFTAVFAELVCATSIAKMGRYRADRIEYVGETVAGHRATVKTKAFYQGRGVSLDYEMALAGGRWRVVNYAVNGVDNGRSYRRQFDKILEKETVASLIARIRKKVAETKTDSDS